MSTTLCLHGSWVDDDCRLLRRGLRAAADDGGRLVVDLTGVDRVGMTLIGLMLLARGHLKADRPIQIRGARPRSGPLRPAYVRGHE